MDCIRKLCDAMDTSCNEVIELSELRRYCEEHKTRLPIGDEVIEQMFREAASGRGYLSEATKDEPLTHEEIAAAVRGRH